MLQTKVVEEIKHTLYSIYMFLENRAAYETTWKKYGKARQATNDNITWRRKDALCMPDNYGKSTDTHNT
jgi:hypothetical protein